MNSHCSAMRRVLAMASGRSRNSAAISAGDLRWRSAFCSSRRPAASSVVLSRMQVSTSSSGRPAGVAWRTSLVATSGMRKCARDVDQRAVEPLLVGIEMALQVDVEAVGEEALEEVESRRVESRRSPVTTAGPSAPPARQMRPSVWPSRSSHVATDSPFGARSLVSRDQSAEVLVAGAVGGEEIEQSRVEREGGACRRYTRTSTLPASARTDERAQPGALRRLMKTRRAVDAVAIAERQRRITERRGARDQILRQVTRRRGKLKALRQRSSM